MVHELRAAGYARPIVVITADNRRETVMECVSAGVNDYLLKPFSKVQLVNKLRMHLRK